MPTWTTMPLRHSLGSSRRAFLSRKAHNRRLRALKKASQSHGGKASPKKACSSPEALTVISLLGLGEGPRGMNGDRLVARYFPKGNPSISVFENKLEAALRLLFTRSLSTTVLLALKSLSKWGYRVGGSDRRSRCSSSSSSFVSDRFAVGIDDYVTTTTAIC